MEAGWSAGDSDGPYTQLPLTLGCVQWKPTHLLQIQQHPLKLAQTAQIAVGKQPRGSKVPHLVPDFSSTAVFCVTSLSAIPCGLLNKLKTSLSVLILDGQPAEIPAAARFLRSYPLTSPVTKGDGQGTMSHEDPKSCGKRQRDAGETGFGVVFGLPWSCEEFIERACSTGHPDFSLSKDLEVALENHLNMTEQQLADHRMWWCRKWLKRASELDNEEKQDWAQRPLHIRQNTSPKRLLLTAEILKNIGYEDLAVVEIEHARCSSPCTSPACPP